MLLHAIGALLCKTESLRTPHVRAHKTSLVEPAVDRVVIVSVVKRGWNWDIMIISSDE